MHWSPGFEKKWVKRLSELGYSKDSINFFYKGGGIIRQKALSNIYASIKKERFIELAGKYGLDYVVEENKYDTGLDFPISYKNESFSLYKIRED